MESVKDYSTPSREVTMPGPIDYHDIPRKMKLEYNFPAAGKTYRVLDQIGGLLVHFQKQQVDLRELMTDAANLISKQFSLKEVGIGLKASDGTYRYEVLVGYRPETEAVTRKLVYTYEQFTDASIYKGTMISKYTKVFLSEDNPWLDSEKDTYSTPSLLGMTRRSLDDYLEGDYLDTHIFGKNDELIGWIEFAGTTYGKLPDMSAIRWVEFIGRIIAAAAVTQPKGTTKRLT
jgi:hypothetical protein